MRLFVGLGNPGKKYEKTRHNVGFMVIDELAKQWAVSMSSEKKFKGVIGFSRVDGEQVILLKPSTFMNLSGEAVQAVMDFYNLENDNVVVIYDDLAMAVGKLRGRTKGSSGGHNGIKSLILHLATEEFKRFKIGINSPTYGAVSDYVLGKFSDEDMLAIAPAIDKIVRACNQLLSTDFVQAVNGLNINE